MPRVFLKWGWPTIHLSYFLVSPLAAIRKWKTVAFLHFFKLSPILLVVKYNRPYIYNVFGVFFNFMLQPKFCCRTAWPVSDLGPVSLSWFCRRYFLNYILNNVNATHYRQMFIQNVLPKSFFFLATGSLVIWASLWENRSSVFPTMSDTKWAAQSLNMARGFKFRF